MFTHMSSGLDYDHDPNSSYTEDTHLFGDGMSKKEKQDGHWKSKAFIIFCCVTDTC